MSIIHVSMDSPCRYGMSILVLITHLNMDSHIFMDTPIDMDTALSRDHPSQQKKRKEHMCLALEKRERTKIEHASISIAHSTHTGREGRRRHTNNSEMVRNSGYPSLSCRPRKRQA